MKVLIDEKVKHRLVGIAVIISIGIVFAPAILKKSQRRLEDVRFSVKLPSKPTLPKVLVRDSNAIFQEVKVAHVTVPPVDKVLLPTSTLAKAKPLSLPTISSSAIAQIDNKRETLPRVEKVPSSAQSNLPQSSPPQSSRSQSSPSQFSSPQASPPKLVQTAKFGSAPAIAAASPTAMPTAIDATILQAPPIKAKPVPVHHQPVLAKKPHITLTRAPVVKHTSKHTYGVQLATFAIHSNAIGLVGKLKNKGYQAQYNTVLGKDGVVYYKVVVGNTVQRGQALRLKKKLSQAMQINGFIITKGIS